MLMEEDDQEEEEDIEVALQAAERSFYQILQHSSSHFTNSPDISDSSNGESVRSHRPLDGDHDDDNDDYNENSRQDRQPDIDLSEKLEEVLLLCKVNNDPKKNSSKRDRAEGSSSRTRSLEPEPIDLQSLLMQCAQAVASFDHRTASQKLKEIRSHSSKYGDGTRRLAFYFAEALEARVCGTRGTHSPPMNSRTSMVDILKANIKYVQACPFNTMSYYVANKTIFYLASQATKLHIIDFGVHYGFQWACLIHALSSRPGGPPMLRITGIEMQKSAYRISERVEETGQRLKRFCDKFNVPFEYNLIRKNWESIDSNELEINRDETTVVNCLYCLRYVPDETLYMSSPRDVILKLFRDINPDLFVFAEVNGMYNSPFFVTRFREALFYYSSFFDIFEATIPEEDSHRTLMEREIFVKDAMNVIACEGEERVERPETYKQWQGRVIRAGFRPLELNKQIMKEAKQVVRRDYHKDFVIDNDRYWMLQGWKGRVIYALSFWKPAVLMILLDFCFHGWKPASISAREWAFIYSSKRQ